MQKFIVTLEPTEDGGVVATKYEPVGQHEHGFILQAEIIEIGPDRRLEFYADLALAELLGAAVIMDGEQARVFKARVESIGRRVPGEHDPEAQAHLVAHLNRSLDLPAADHQAEGG